MNNFFVLTIFGCWGGIFGFDRIANVTEAPTINATFEDLQVPIDVCRVPYIANGEFAVHIGSSQSSINFNLGDVVQVECHDGYKLTNTDLKRVYLTCHSNGSWIDTFGSQNIPSCISYSGCAVPRVANGYVATPPKFLPGDHARVFCFSGYSLFPAGARPLIRCNSDGSWGSYNEAPLSCEVDTSLFCQKPSGFVNGGFRALANETSNPAVIMYRSGTSLMFYCNEGFRMTSPTSIIKCDNGIWHGSTSDRPSCQLKRQTDRCGPVPEFERTKHYVLQNVKDTVDGNQIRAFDQQRFSHGTRVIYVCEAGFNQIGSSMVECQKGEWSGLGPKCLRQLGCSEIPPTVENAEFSIYPHDDSDFVTDKSRKLTSDGSQAYYFCRSGFQMTNVNSTSLVCKDGEWTGVLPSCERRISCDAPTNIDNAKWIVGWVWGDYRVGAVARYVCNPGYSLIGVEAITCQSNGLWSDSPPLCLLQDEFCSKPSNIQNGFFICKPNECNSFHVGAEVFYFCKQGFERRPSTINVITCVSGGNWRGAPPTCVAVESVEPVYITEHVVSSPFTVVVISSCILIGVLVMIVLAVMLRWIRAKRAVLRQPRLLQPDQNQMPATAPPYSITPVDLDRLALIAFSDDAYMLPSTLLPTYEEAVSGELMYDCYVPRVSRVGHTRSSRSTEYRPLASIQSSVQQEDDSRTTVNDHRRNSIVTMVSNALSAGISAGFGSNDTIYVAPASDATSTSVTVNTYDSMASISASQRATRGSLESSSTHAGLTCDGTPSTDHRVVSSVWEHHDSAGANDTLRSLTSRSLHSDTTSRIVELPEDSKNE